MIRYRIIKPIKKDGIIFSSSLIPLHMNGERLFNRSSDFDKTSGVGGVTRETRGEYLFNRFIKNSAFISYCNDLEATVFFHGFQMFIIPSSSYEVIEDFPETYKRKDDIDNIDDLFDNVLPEDNIGNKLEKHVNLKLTNEMLSEIANKGVSTFFYGKDGRARGLRYKEILYINALFLGWNIPTTHSEFGNVIRERCGSTWIYNNFIEKYHMSVDSLMGGNLLESDLLPVEHRANMFYITEQGNKIGYWRINKVLSQIIMCNKLKDIKVMDISNASAYFLFEKETRLKYAMKCRASILMYKSFTENFITYNIENSDSEMFYHSFCTTEETGKFCIVEKTQIRDWYNESNHYEMENGSNLSESCMRHESCCDYFSLYVENSKVCKMLIYTDSRSSGIMGRALLWKVSDGTNTYDVMDRIYYCYERILPLFTRWAVENNYVRKKRQSYESWEFIKPDGNAFDNFRDMYIQLDKYDFSYYPYCDTFYVLDMENGRLCQDNDGFEARHLRCTGGGYEDDGEYVYLDYCETRVHVDEACWSDYHDCYIHPDDCFHSDYDNSYIFSDEGVYCEDIEQDIHRDSTVYSDKDDCYYTSEGAVYSEHYDSEIGANNAIQCVGGDYVYDEDYERIGDVNYIIDSDEHKKILIEKEAYDELYSTDTITKEIDKTIDKSIELLTKLNENEK